MFKITDCITVLGRRGCGKSHLCKTIQDCYPKIVVIDTMDEYHDGLTFTDFNSFAEQLLVFKRDRKKKFKIIFKFSPEAKNKTVIFNNILKILFKFGNLLIVVEEVQMYSNPHFLPSWLENCLLIGRHRKLSMIFTTQRPGQLHKTILSQCNHIFAGQMHEKNDIKYISGFLGVNAEKLVKLEPRKFLYFNPNTEVRIVSNDFKN